MESLYVCLFSNGHVKVGRSIDPNSRMAQHVDRVSCMGVSLESSYVTDCPDCPEARERKLIDACAAIATTRFHFEWFTGLKFDDVCKLAYDAAHSDLDPAKTWQTRWSLLIADLSRAGWTRTALALECNCGQATISRLALGQQDEPMYSMGEKLIALHQSNQSPTPTPPSVSSPGVVSSALA